MLCGINNAECKIVCVCNMCRVWCLHHVLCSQTLGRVVDTILVLWAAVLPSSASIFSLVMSMLQFICIHPAVTFVRHWTQICRTVTATIMIPRCIWSLDMQWNRFFGLHTSSFVLILSAVSFFSIVILAGQYFTLFSPKLWQSEKSYTLLIALHIQSSLMTVIVQLLVCLPVSLLVHLCKK